MMIIFCNIQPYASENSLKPRHPCSLILVMLLLPMMRVLADDPPLNILQNGDFDRNLERGAIGLMPMRLRLSKQTVKKLNL